VKQHRAVAAAGQTQPDRASGRVRPGCIRRLNEARLLGRLARVSSVSGGSITAATLGLRWNELDFQDGIAGRLDELVTEPVRELSRHTIDVSSVVEGLMTFSSVGERVAHAYREHLYGDATLQSLPADDEGPRFVICSTNMESGVLFRFSRPYLADWRVGLIPDPDTALADAVAASSAFPPVLSPFTLDLRDAGRPSPGTSSPTRSTAGGSRCPMGALRQSRPRDRLEALPDRAGLGRRRAHRQRPTRPPTGRYRCCACWR
jgi:hypothetical protein